MHVFDFILKSQESYHSLLKSEWRKFMDGKPVNTDIVDPSVHASWKRSKDFNVDPYYLGGPLLLSSKDAEEQRLSHQELMQSFGSVILLIQEIAAKRNLNVQLFDRHSRSIQLVMFPKPAPDDFHYENEDEKYIIEKYIIENIPRNVSEDVVGTSAPYLAIKENRPIQIVGAEHFNYHLHKFYCSAAPIHDSRGTVVGALNIVSHLKPGAMDTLGLASCLADIYDNRALIATVLEELNVQDYALQKIIEYLPRGVAYVNDANEPKAFNKKLLSLLGIKDDPYAVEELSRYIQASGFLNSEHDLKHREFVLDIKGRKKSFLVSTQKISGTSGQIKNKIILLEDTLSVMKSVQKLRGNEAVYMFRDIVGNNETLVAAKNLAERIAGVRSPVLIHGESGTGKELFAQAVHNASTRRGNPFVAINCGAIPSELIESELFGYEPGAFTGALKGGKPGKLELASGGTLFLDEVESMPLNVQIKLLRAISTRKISKIGGVEEIPIDVRIVSATKLDLLQEADEGNFREDLYYRISTITIKLPPLRERIDDIPTLAEYFIDAHAKEFGLSDIDIHPEFMKALTYYCWRGNVRELSNVLERAVVLLGDERVLTLEHLPDRMVRAYRYKDLKKGLESAENEFESEEDSSDKPSNILKMAEEIAIKSALERTSGNMTRAAEQLGISKPTLYSKISQNPKLKRLRA